MDRGERDGEMGRRGGGESLRASHWKSIKAYIKGRSMGEKRKEGKKGGWGWWFEAPGTPGNPRPHQKKKKPRYGKYGRVG